MKSKIKILMLFIAYLLSVSHNIIPHDHIPIELCNNNCNHTQNISDLMSLERFDELMNSFSLHHHHNKKDVKIPFPHCHIILGHDNNQIRSEFKTIIDPDINFIKNTTFINPNILNFTFASIEYISLIIKPPNYNSFNSFRAPPFLS